MVLVLSALASSEWMGGLSTPGEPSRTPGRTCGFFIAGTAATFGASAAAFVLLLFCLFFVTAGAIVLFRAVSATCSCKDSVPGRTGQRP